MPFSWFDGGVLAECDGCGTNEQTKARSWSNAHKFLKLKKGWKTIKLNNGQWKTICDVCVIEWDLGERDRMRSLWGTATLGEYKRH